MSTTPEKTDRYRKLAIINLWVSRISKADNNLLKLTLQSLCFQEEGVVDWHFVYVPKQQDPVLPSSLTTAARECSNIKIHLLTETQLINERIIPLLARSSLAEPVLPADLWKIRLQRRIQWTRGAAMELFGDLVNSSNQFYSHWGFADPDVVYGSLIESDLFAGDFDVVTSTFQTLSLQQVYLHGHLTVFKNTLFLNSLWRNWDFCGDGFTQYEDESEDEGYLTSCVLNAALGRVITFQLKRMETADLKRPQIDPGEGCFQVQLMFGLMSMTSEGELVRDDGYRAFVSRVRVPGSGSCSTPIIKPPHPLEIENLFPKTLVNEDKEGHSWIPTGRRAQWWLPELTPEVRSLLKGTDLIIRNAELSFQPTSLPRFIVTPNPLDCGAYETYLGELRDWKLIWDRQRLPTTTSPLWPHPLSRSKASANETGFYRFPFSEFQQSFRIDSDASSLSVGGSRYCIAKSSPTYTGFFEAPKFVKSSSLEQGYGHDIKLTEELIARLSSDTITADQIPGNEYAMSPVDCECPSEIESSSSSTDFVNPASVVFGVFVVVCLLFFVAIFFWIGFPTSTRPARNRRKSATLGTPPHAVPFSRNQSQNRRRLITSSAFLASVCLLFLYFLSVSSSLTLELSSDGIVVKHWSETQQKQPQHREQELSKEQTENSETGNSTELSLSTVAICTTFKNEAPYLLEFVSYYWFLGVRKFFLFDDGSIDDPEDVLGEWIESGFVELWLVPKRVEENAGGTVIPQQKWAFGECVLRLAPQKKIDWLLLVDVDEFVVLDDWVRVRAAASGFARLPLPHFLSVPPWNDPAFAGGLCLTSLSFSSHKYLDPPDGPCISSYILRESHHNRGAMDTKCLLRVGAQNNIDNHVCDVTPFRRNAQGHISNVSGIPDVQIGPPVDGPLALFHFRSKSLKTCAFHALQTNQPQDYKRQFIVSNCLSLHNGFREIGDNRLASLEQEVMKLARCMHPRRWYCRFADLFPEIAAVSVEELCRQRGLFGLSFDDPRLIPSSIPHKDPFALSSWLAFEKQLAVENAVHHHTAACTLRSPNFTLFSPASWTLNDYPPPSLNDIDLRFWRNVADHNFTTRKQVFEFAVDFLNRAVAQNNLPSATRSG